MDDAHRQALSKVPAVTLGFWVIKILATTLGETGGDTVTMTLGWGYLAGTALFAALLLALVAAQIVAHRFNPVLYWATIIASTTFGTTMADFADRSLGIGYAGGSALLLACLAAVLGAWYASERTISVDTVSSPRVEASTGGPSPSPRPSAPRSATGSPTPTASATRAGRSYSARPSPWWSRCTTGPGSPGSGCSGRPSS